MDEGIATFFGGSSEYPLIWHLEKLKIFLNEDPLFKINELSNLEMDIPNGEFLTDLRYAIGGLIAKNIHEKEGMQGIFEMLQCGRNDQDYFNLIERKLGVSQESFENTFAQKFKKFNQ